MSYPDYLQHYGVLGMKWGVRKQKDKSGASQKKLKMSAKTKSGRSITAIQSKTPRLSEFLAKHNINLQKQLNATKNMDLFDDRGSKIGDLQLFCESPNSVNVTWVGIKPKYRGSGYATAAMKMAEDYARKYGAKQLTLEVPGNSPDARHIYEKQGFVSTGVLSDAETDSVWGGLTCMRKKL